MAQFQSSVRRECCCGYHVFLYDIHFFRKSFCKSNPICANFVLIFLSIVHFLGFVEYGDSVGWYESYGRELYFIITTHYTLLAMFMIAMPFFIFISENGATSLCTAMMFCLFGW